MRLALYCIVRSYQLSFEQNVTLIDERIMEMFNDGRTTFHYKQYVIR